MINLFVYLSQYFIFGEKMALRALYTNTVNHEGGREKHPNKPSQTNEKIETIKNNLITSLLGDDDFASYETNGSLKQWLDQYKQTLGSQIDIILSELTQKGQDLAIIFEIGQNGKIDITKLTKISGLQAIIQSAQRVKTALDNHQSSLAGEQGDETNNNKALASLMTHLLATETTQLTTAVAHHTTQEQLIQAQKQLTDTTTANQYAMQNTGTILTRQFNATQRLAHTLSRYNIADNNQEPQKYIATFQKFIMTAYSISQSGKGGIKFWKGMQTNRTMYFARGRHQNPRNPNAIIMMKNMITSLTNHLASQKSDTTLSADSRRRADVLHDMITKNTETYRTKLKDTIAQNPVLGDDYITKTKLVVQNEQGETLSIQKNPQSSYTQTLYSSTHAMNKLCNDFAFDPNNSSDDNYQQKFEQFVFSLASIRSLPVLKTRPLTKMLQMQHMYKSAISPLTSDQYLDYMGEIIKSTSDRIKSAIDQEKDMTKKQILMNTHATLYQGHVAYYKHIQKSIDSLIQEQ